MAPQVLPVEVRGEVRVQVPAGVPVETAWRAYTEPALRRRWFRLPGRLEHEDVDVREGGHHLLRGAFVLDDRTEHLDGRARFLELAAPQRVVWTYEVRVDDVLRSVALCSTSFVASAGTELVHEEQFTVFGADDAAAAAGAAERRGGVRLQLNGWRGVALAAARG
ncbi:SRPBCC domain-containing protein [Amnibacterium sp. CER49]|uniref:SRPBCC domain-containing protein n=1 Tax=Amnibacterium sp. CER49 TaxID=3039161 RepID=UPI002449EABF|nr:SRPBCC domain-containing protein [Amnibacterium sp. CER49]MDH2443397.1 SRPBCC domain-containing protein [Amnibacterium sp. CER49]